MAEEAKRHLDRLTAKEKDFTKYFSEGWPHRKAAELAGYHSKYANHIGLRLLKKTCVVKYIRELDELRCERLKLVRLLGEHFKRQVIYHDNCIKDTC